MGDLRTPEKIRTLQQKLYRKAKTEPKFRFYTLYDKVYRPDILHHAYRLAKNNDGGPGVDGVTFDEIESQEGGVGRFLAELGEELRKETYCPQPVRRVMIPKPDGGERPLGIPCIRDRVAQGAAKLLLEPIFEADFTDTAYGYRPARGVHDAVRRVDQLLRQGCVDVVDADLASYFDTIPHPELMKSVARRISARKMLRLIKSWLETPVEDHSERGRRRLTGGKKHRMGVPQGGVISPLLANIYMRRYLQYWADLGLEERLGMHVVNYADDFVILCPRGRAEQALRITRRIMESIGLTLHEEKTHVGDAWKQSFDFLGRTFGTQHRRSDGKRYLGHRPSKRAIRRFYGTIRGFLHRGNMAPLDDVIRSLNHRLRGWADHHSFGTLCRAYRTVDFLVSRRLRQWLCRRCKVPNRGTRRFPDEVLYSLYPTPLLRLTDLRRPSRSHA